MILITEHGGEIAQWIEDHCATGSRYTTSHAWPADLIEACRDRSRIVELVLDLTPTDQMLFDIAHAGRFIINPRNSKWIDATEVNRAILSIQRANTD